MRTITILIGVLLLYLAMTNRHKEFYAAMRGKIIYGK